jgi:hypothetical protein
MDQKIIVAAARLIHAEPTNVAVRLAAELDVSRQSASRWLSIMKRDGLIASGGLGRGTKYTLLDAVKVQREYEIDGLSEDRVWSELCSPVVSDLPKNVRDIWHHGLTEMINNAIDHSGSKVVRVSVRKNALLTSASVIDDGEGIFLKIQRALKLYDTREAILELAKGKFTTDPANHSGEGIFFSSKMFDHFSVHSGALFFLHDCDAPDILLESSRKDTGTAVYMYLNNDSPRTSKEVFDQFALPEEFSFAKTIVPVRLAQHEGEKLVSRSQAKRLTRRFERFHVVMLDFSDVEEIGQGFADEVFRVFQNAHPEITMTPMRMSPAVAAMISRVKNPM